MLKKFFATPDSYKNQIAQLDKMDTIIALLVILAYFVMMGVSGVIYSLTSTLEITIIGGAINLIFVGIVLLILKIRHQGIDSIGLRAGNVKLSLTMGGFLAIMLFFCNCLSNVLFENQSFIPVMEILGYIVYFFTVGLAEEVVFRGFLETRLNALTKRVWMDVIIAGILFVLMHFPFRMVAYNMSFLDFMTKGGHVTDLFITHLILSYIRIKSDSLYGAILPHWMSDLANKIVTHGI